MFSAMLVPRDLSQPAFHLSRHLRDDILDEALRMAFAAGAVIGDVIRISLPGTGIVGSHTITVNDALFIHSPF